MRIHGRGYPGTTGNNHGPQRPGAPDRGHTSMPLGARRDCPQVAVRSRRSVLAMRGNAGGGDHAYYFAGPSDVSVDAYRQFGVPRRSLTDSQRPWASRPAVLRSHRLIPVHRLLLEAPELDVPSTSFDPVLDLLEVAGLVELTPDTHGEVTGLADLGGSVLPGSLCDSWCGLAASSPVTIRLRDGCGSRPVGCGSLSCRNARGTCWDRGDRGQLI